MGDVYEQSYGRTFDYFQIKNRLFIILNTEVNNGSIEGDQLKMFNEAIEKKNVKDVFIFSHRPIWTEGYDSMDKLFEGNTSSSFTTNFSADILPLINKESKTKSIYWFSGSLGGKAPASFFYHKEKENLTYLATAIRSLPRDGAIKVYINSGNVSFGLMSFTNQKLKPIENYDINYWQTTESEEGKFNWRLAPLYIYNIVTGVKFWYGFVVAFILLGVISKLRRRKK